MPWEPHQILVIKLPGNHNIISLCVVLAEVTKGCPRQQQLKGTWATASITILKI